MIARPTGGYGMNTAVGDSFDIGWKVAAAVHGHGGPALLRSYEDERRPVGMKNIDRSGKHWKIHATVWEWCDQSRPTVSSDTKEGQELRARIAEFVSTHDNENKDHGLEFGFRYKSHVIVPEHTNGTVTATTEPPWHEKDYIPSTWPGARAPHVFLKDGTTSIFDLFGSGPEFTLADFTTEGDYIQKFQPELAAAKIPCKLVHLPNEPHVRKIWERDAVLVRPDDHVAWRSNGQVPGLDVVEVLGVVTGNNTSSIPPGESGGFSSEKMASFTSTVGNIGQGELQGLAEFQK
jgi:FAD-dependent monooxygenase